MATLEQQRRASGQRMEAQRRAGGEAMIKRRTGRDEVNDVNALVRPPRQRQTLRDIGPRGSVPAQVGTGVYQAPPRATNTGGGIASPLTEKTKVVSGKTVPDRDYYSNGLLSSDGLFVLPAIRTLRLEDANGDPVVMNLANPNSTL